MIFNSFAFAFFLPVTFLLYWFVFNKRLKNQNTFLIIASYFFYAWWDWRFLFLIMFSTFLDYFFGLKIHGAANRSAKKTWLYLSIVANLGTLAWFKYFNFFISTLSPLLESMGFSPNISSLNIILPIGISFYTFHGLSYVIDVYYDRLRPTTNFIDYSLFVCFFPLLVAGPIERATHLLPQVQSKRQFSLDTATDGMRQMLWGFFKKIVIADSCAPLVNAIFQDYQHLSGSTLFLGGILFAFQIYGDFSGYSDIALGTAKLLGFDLIKNFSYPYFSRNIAEFWRRWHISLSSWFRDYVYIPLGGNRGPKWKSILNVLIIFILSGFWHGANWTFIIWGLFHGLLFVPLLLFGKSKTYVDIVAQNSVLPSVKEVIQMATTFTLVVIGWIFFRAENIHVAFDYLLNMADRSLLTIPTEFRSTLPWIAVMLTVEWVQRRKFHGLQNLERIQNRGIRWSIYIALTIIILDHFFKQNQEFIYFQF